jgi:hypothetical protein
MNVQRPLDEVPESPDRADTGPDSIRTGADQPWDPEDLAAAKGQDPTAASVERSRRELAEEGPAVVEKTVP